MVSLRRISLFALLSILPGFSQERSIVIGFAGGLVAHDNAAHGEVQLANRLHDAGNVQVRMFENRHGEQARREVLRLLDADGDGALSVEEKLAARIAIYGHSWGASEAIQLARRLGRDDVPVLLTIQVDSVQKWGEDDASIPANVAQAANFFQLDGLLHGRARIYAADGSRTRILGNVRFAYKDNPVSCDGHSWFARIFMRPHIEIESDPAVWGQVESLIRTRLQLPPRGE